MEDTTAKRLLRSEQDRVKKLEGEQRNEILKTRLSEGKDAHERFLTLAPIISQKLKGTAFVKNQPWSEHDVETTGDLLIDLAPFAHPGVFPSLWEHLLAAPIYARLVASEV